MKRQDLQKNEMFQTWKGRASFVGKQSVAFSLLLLCGLCALHATLTSLIASKLAAQP